MAVSGSRSLTENINGKDSACDVHKLIRTPIRIGGKKRKTDNCSPLQLSYSKGNHTYADWFSP